VLQQALPVVAASTNTTNTTNTNTTSPITITSPHQKSP
jgi:hypothetical protein